MEGMKCDDRIVRKAYISYTETYQSSHSVYLFSMTIWRYGKLFSLLLESFGQSPDTIQYIVEYTCVLYDVVSVYSR